MTKAKVIEKMILRCAAVFEVSVADILAKPRGARDVSRARNVLFYLLRPIMPTADIGSLVGRRACSSVYGGCGYVEMYLNKDSDFRVAVMSLTTEFSAARREFAMD